MQTEVRDVVFTADTEGLRVYDVDTGLAISVISSNGRTVDVTPIQLATNPLDRAHSLFPVIHKVCRRDDGLALESLRR